MKKRIALTCKDPGQFFQDCPGCKHYDGCEFFNKVKTRPGKQTRVTLFFTWSTGEADYIDLPFGLLSPTVKILVGYDQNFIPIVQIGKGKFYFGTEKGTLKPL